MSLQSTQTIELNTSLDSSDLCEQIIEDSISSTSTISVDVKKKITSKKKLINYDSPVQKSRFLPIEEDADLFEKGGNPFVGFIGGFNKVPIEINKSKLKKAQQFLQMTPAMFSEQEQAMDKQAANQTPLRKNLFQQDEFSDFQIGFKNVGTGLDVKVQKQNEEKVKKFFDFESLRKSTKIKLASKDKKKNFQKTVNQPQKKNITKTQNFENERKNFQSVISFSNHFQSIKLQNLPEISFQRKQEFHQSAMNYEFQTIFHRKKQCKMPFCYFCQTYPEKTLVIQKQWMIDQLGKVAGKQNIPQSIDVLWQIILFKLEKYSFFYNKLINKEINANNVLIQLHKKIKAMQKGYKGYLHESLGKINSKICGKSINLMVMNIKQNESINTYFVKLTDGWSIAYAIISDQNLLFKYVHRFKAGMKINIVDWIIYPICNMLDYHPDDPGEFPCIQFFYNCSRILSQNEKIGRPSQIFYRPLQKCKLNGGNIAILEGIIIRMFTKKSSISYHINIIELYNIDEGSFLIQVRLPVETSIVQLFRLHYCYRFYKLKKTDSLLQFTQLSKFEELPNPKRIDEVKQILEKRLINKAENPLQRLKGGGMVDIISDKKNFLINEKTVEINEKIENQVLLQQYKVVQMGDSFVLMKGQCGSILKKMPKIYDCINYILF